MFLVSQKKDTYFRIIHYTNRMNQSTLGQSCQNKDIGEYKMNFYQFINSKDIREHLQNINYQFNAAEAAWLVWQCREATPEVRCKAWNEIIETMPDMEPPVRELRRHYKSIHQFLKDYMKALTRALEEFKQNEDSKGYKYIYEVKYWEEWDYSEFDKGCGWKGGLITFSNYKKAIEAIKEDKEQEYSHKKFKIEKIRLDHPKPSTIIMNDDLQIINAKLHPLNLDDDRILNWESFFDMCFDFPTPFKKGDILWDPKSESQLEFLGHRDELVVVTSVGTNDFSDKEKNPKRRGVDYTDMHVIGYFLDEKGQIYNEVTWNYMDYELYRGKLTGKNRILKAISNYEKGEIDGELLATAYHKIMTEEYAKIIETYFVTDKGLELAGLKEPESNEKE